MRQSNVSAHYVIREDGNGGDEWSTWPDNDWHACIFNRHSIGVEMSGFATRGFDDPLLATTARMSKGLRRDRGLRLQRTPEKARSSGLGAVGTYLTEVVQIAE